MSIGRLLKKVRRQDAVYWPPAGQDQFGNPKYGAPIDLKVRWDDVSEVYTTAKGETLTSRSKVMLGQDVLELGVLWQGTVATLPAGGAAKPMSVPKAYSINRFDKMPDMKAKNFVRTAWL